MLWRGVHTTSIAGAFKKLMAIKWLLSPILDLAKGVQCGRAYVRRWCGFFPSARIAEAEPLALRNAYLCLSDHSPTTPFDAQCFCQEIWPFRLIPDTEVGVRLDIGSRAIFVGILIAITNVTFVDIGLPGAELDGLDCISGTILAPPFEDNLASSVLCLQIAEHVGLRRYGDLLDPGGTRKACRELARVLAHGGHLYSWAPFSFSRVWSNPHFTHTPQLTLGSFHDLELTRFSGIGAVYSITPGSHES